MKTRPIGITILAVLGFLSVLFYLVMTVIALVNPAQANNLLQGMSGGGAGPAPLQHLAAILPAYFLVTGLFSAALSWGLWTLKNWARILCLVVIGLSVIGGAVEIVVAWSHSTLPASAPPSTHRPKPDRCADWSGVDRNSQRSRWFRSSIFRFESLIMSRPIANSL